MADPLAFPFLERCTGRYEATLVDNDGVTPIPGATLSSLVLTVYVIKADGSDQILRGPQQSVLNSNNVTISAGGLLVWLVQVADTTLVEDVPFERHLALFEWTWPNGAGKHEVILLVRNLHRVP